VGRSGATRSAEGLAETTASTIAMIGNRIRELRRRRGMTLQAIAGVSGLSPSMISLVERGRASPSIGSLIVIANALGISMSELVSANQEQRQNRLVVRSADATVVRTARHVVRRLLREDRERGVSVALNEYEPHTGSAEQPISHTGFEYGFILQGELNVKVDEKEYVLQKGDLIAYRSRRKHKVWNHGSKRAKTLWINLVDGI
jgi:transcriptional regulator with XRE-family HTH domain